MTAEPVRHQRSEGAILLSMGPKGILRLREAHAAKVRIPFGGREAILINTGGGLAGGDRFTFDITAEADTRAHRHLAGGRARLPLAGARGAGRGQRSPRVTAPG